MGDMGNNDRHPRRIAPTGSSIGSEFTAEFMPITRHYLAGILGERLLKRTVDFPQQAMLERTSAENITPIPFPTIEQHEKQHAHQRFQIESFTEETNPDGAIRAQQIHGGSYIDAGYVNPGAVVDPENDTRLLEEFDTARSSTNDKIDVEYRLATPLHVLDRDMGEGALRVVTAKEGGNVSDLSEFARLNDEAQQMVTENAQQFGIKSVKVIAALSLTKEAAIYDIKNGHKDPAVSFELIRDILQDAVKADTHEKWIITFAEPAYKKLLKPFGEYVLPQSGEKFKAHAGDVDVSSENPRRNPGLELVPVVVEPDKLLDNILRKINTLDITKETWQNKLLSDNLLHMADGLDPQLLSEEVRAYVDDHRNPSPHSPDLLAS